MTDRTAHDLSIPPDDARVRALIRRLSDTEAELRALLGANVDLVLDPATGTPLFFRETQQELLRTQEALRQANNTLEQRVEARTAEAERRAAELDATLGAIADGLIIFDAHGTIVRLNAVAEAMIGDVMAQGHLTVREQASHLHSERADGTPFTPDELPAARALRGETVVGEVIVLHHHERVYWLSVSAAPIYGMDGELLGAVLTFTDITAIHELQEQQQLLLHLVSHDLRTPLAIITGHAELVQDEVRALNVDETTLLSLDAIRRGVRRMNVMIEDLTDMARAEGGRLHLIREPIALAPFLADLLARSEKALDVSRVRLEVPAALPPALADPNRLERIVTNLLSNALKYSDPGTPITISAHQQDGELVASVTDRGKGIAPEDLPHLFKRFYRTQQSERKAEGIGLGLYITRLLVEAHGVPAEAGKAKAGGRIWVASEPGQGSTFSFSLPVAE